MQLPAVTIMVIPGTFVESSCLLPPEPQDGSRSRCPLWKRTPVRKSLPVARLRRRRRSTRRLASSRTARPSRPSTHGIRWRPDGRCRLPTVRPLAVRPPIGRECYGRNNKRMATAGCAADAPREKARRTRSTAAPKSPHESRRLAVPEMITAPGRPGIGDRRPSASSR